MVFCQHILFRLADRVYFSRSGGTGWANGDNRGKLHFRLCSSHTYTTLYAYKHQTQNTHKGEKEKEKGLFGFVFYCSSLSGVQMRFSVDLAVVKEKGEVGSFFKKGEKKVRVLEGVDRGERRRNRRVK